MDNQRCSVMPGVLPRKLSGLRSAQDDLAATKSHVQRQNKKIVELKASVSQLQAAGKPPVASRIAERAVTLPGLSAAGLRVA